jgi:hypothetical protein
VKAALRPTGRVRNTLVTYDVEPSDMRLLRIPNLLASAITLRSLARTHRTASIGAAVFTVATIIHAARPAVADLQVRMPTVDYRELEFEHNGLVTFDKKGSSLNGEQSYTNAIGYGVLPWWGIELEGELEASRDQAFAWQATTLENTFQLTEPGQYLFNLGLFAEYSQATGQTNPNSFTFGPIVQKELNNVLGTDSLHTLNVFFSRDVGHGSSKATGFEYAWQSRLFLNGHFDPAIEFYGSIDDISHPGRFGDEQHSVGPALVGTWNFSPYGKLKYEVGYQFGYTQAAPRGAVRWKLEYEIVF